MSTTTFTWWGRATVIIGTLALTATHVVAASANPAETRAGSRSKQGVFVLHSAKTTQQSGSEPRGSTTASKTIVNETRLDPVTSSRHLKCELMASPCHETEVCDDGSTPQILRTWNPAGELLSQSEPFCPVEGEEEVTPRAPGPGEASAALRTVPLPQSRIKIQPPDGETLVNLATVFSTSAAAFDAPVTLLGRNVVLHIVPAQFTWHHGDGTSQTTTQPGTPWAEGSDAASLIHHVYTARATDLAVSLDTTWTATWTLDGIDQGAVPGSVTRTGPPVSLDVLEARPVLTG
jgi:hypothetical protein